MGAHQKRSRWGWVFGAMLAAFALAALCHFELDARAGTQQCNTECQSKMTDCILACDGMRSCEEACKRKGQSCVNACSPDAGYGVTDGAVDAALERDISDARAGDTRAASAAKDAATRAAARDR